MSNDITTIYPEDSADSCHDMVLFVDSFGTGTMLFTIHSLLKAHSENTFWSNDKPSIQDDQVDIKGLWPQLLY